MTSVTAPESMKRPKSSIQNWMTFSRRLLKQISNLIRRKLNWAKNHANETVPAETEDALEECDKIVLMFDESQLLLEEQFKFDAFLFRCVRVWLREKRRYKKVVAVFAGTNSKVTSFREHCDDYLKPATASSREIRDGSEYHKKGSNQLYPPFFCTTTLGSCLASLFGETEYERPIYYGRPLFAIMAKEETLQNTIPNVLCRKRSNIGNKTGMLWQISWVTGSSWEKHPPRWYSCCKWFCKCFWML